MTRSRSFAAALTALALFSCGAPVMAQQATITRADREAALDALTRRMDHYVFQEKKPAVVARLTADRERLLAIDDAEAFREAVNADLWDTARDRHLTIWVDRRQPGEASGPLTPEEGRDIEMKQAWGFGSVRRLPGNIGLIRLNHFSGHPDAGQAVDDIMRVLAGADALIIDLRDNGGGGESVLNRLLGHLSATPLPMMTIQLRRCAPDPADPEACVQDGSRDEQVRHADAIAAPGFPTQPVYVLTSDNTFSAAEEMAYDLQASGRGMLVGEKTKGGANPSASMSIGPNFMVIMPIGTTVHPLTGTNWDENGVMPDVAVSRDQALTEAYRRALQTPTDNPILAAARIDLSRDPARILREDAGL